MEAKERKAKNWEFSPKLLKSLALRRFFYKLPPEGSCTLFSAKETGGEQSWRNHLWELDWGLIVQMMITCYNRGEWSSQLSLTSSRLPGSYVCVTVTLVNLPFIDCGWSVGGREGGLLAPTRHPLTAASWWGWGTGVTLKWSPSFSRACHVSVPGGLMFCDWIAWEAWFKHRQLLFFTWEKAREGENTTRVFLLNKQAKISQVEAERDVRSSSAVNQLCGCVSVTPPLATSPASVSSTLKWQKADDF